MKIGLQIPNFTWPGGSTTLADIAQTADNAVFASLNGWKKHCKLPTRCGRKR